MTCWSGVETGAFRVARPTVEEARTWDEAETWEEGRDAGLRPCLSSKDSSCLSPSISRSYVADDVSNSERSVNSSASIEGFALSSSSFGGGGLRPKSAAPAAQRSLGWSSRLLAASERASEALESPARPRILYSCPSAKGKTAGGAACRSLQKYAIPTCSKKGYDEHFVDGRNTAKMDGMPSLLLPLTSSLD